MLVYKKGDLLDFTEEAVAHGANCRSTMESGVAKALKLRFPEIYSVDVGDTRSPEAKLGNFSHCLLSNNKFGYNIYTQLNYGRSNRVFVDYGALLNGFYRTCNDLQMKGLKTIAIPKIGAGLGNGDWRLISRLINSVSDVMNIDVTCYIL